MMVTLCTLCGKSFWNQSWVWWPNCSRSEKQWSPWIWLKFSQHATSVLLIDPWYTRKSFTFLFRKTGVIMLPYLANRFQEVQMKVFKHIKFTEQKDYFLLLNVPCLNSEGSSVTVLICLCDIYYFCEVLHNSLWGTLACLYILLLSVCTIFGSIFRWFLPILNSFPMRHLLIISYFYRMGKTVVYASI